MFINFAGMGFQTCIPLGRTSTASSRNNKSCPSPAEATTFYICSHLITDAIPNTDTQEKTHHWRASEEQTCHPVLRNRG